MEGPKRDCCIARAGRVKCIAARDVWQTLVVQQGRLGVDRAAPRALHTLRHRQQARSGKQSTKRRRHELVT